VRYSKRNIYFHELIGLEVSVNDHVDTSLKGVRGRVIDETKNMIVVLTDDGRELKIPKHGGKFTFKLPRTLKVEVLGDLIIGRPEDRLKRFRG